jgi:D-hydroxyproline dehydrogenase subunit beta
MISQTALGELTIGDSHEYGLNPEPFDKFDKTEINEYILNYSKTFAKVPSYAISETWYGVLLNSPAKLNS